MISFFSYNLATLLSSAATDFVCVTVYNNYYFSNGSFDPSQQPDTQQYAYDEVEDGQQQEYYEESEEEDDGMW